MLDRGLSPLSLESLLITAGERIDLIKLGWARPTSAGRWRQGGDLPLLRGGACARAGRCWRSRWPRARSSPYVEWLRGLGIDHIEVSNGSLPMAPERKAELINRLARRLHGHLRGRLQERAGRGAGTVATRCLRDLAAGAALVIAEGRESGTVGLSTPAGAVHADLVESILRAVGHKTVIFEAPQRAQQAWLLRHVGPNVNLGNIGAEDVIALETLRGGLRFDTLDLLPRQAPALLAARASAGGRGARAWPRPRRALSGTAPRHAARGTRPRASRPMGAGVAAGDGPRRDRGARGSAQSASTPSAAGSSGSPPATARPTSRYAVR